MVLVLLCLVVVATFATPEASRVQSILRSSRAYKIANKEYRAKRVAAGLSPDVVPHTQYIRMRDGTLLWTLYWDPRINSSDQLPTLLIRSPYSPLGSENMADLYVPFGFAVVEQNERGTGLSKGDFCFWLTDTFDGLDTISWIQQQPFSNGQVFEIGASADGILTLVDLKMKVPAMSGQWLWITTSDPYATLLQNNQAFREALSKNWLAVMQLNRPQIPPNTYYNTALRNEGFDSSYIGPGMNCDTSKFNWSDINLFHDDFKANVNFPAIHLGGWYDIFLAGQIRTFENFQFNSSVGALGQQQLIIEPRGHCFFESTVDFPDDRLGILWAFERSVDIFKQQVEPRARSLMPRSPKEILPKPLAAPTFKVVLYVMGPEKSLLPKTRKSVTGMFWTGLKDWPSAVPFQLFLSSNRLLSVVSPSRASLSYMYNPADPTPTNGGNNLFLRCGPQNQTANDLRGDNLIFDYLFDQDIAVVGAIQVSLRVKTSRNDTDFVVRVSDVYPGSSGVSMLLGDNIVRMRWRENKFYTTPTTPGEEYVITMQMWSTAYVFNAGHKLRIAVTSSNYPRYSANPNNGNLIWQGGPVYNATNTLILGADSYVVLPTVGLGQLPKISVFK